MDQVSHIVKRNKESRKRVEVKKNSPIECNEIISFPTTDHIDVFFFIPVRLSFSASHTLRYHTPSWQQTPGFLQMFRTAY